MKDVIVDSAELFDFLGKMEEYRKKHKIRYYYKFLVNRIDEYFDIIKYSYQRLRRGYADVDLWNLDYRLSSIIYNHMDGFIKMERVDFIPKLDEDDIPTDFKEQHNNSYEEYAHLYWEVILNDIRTAFEIISKDYDVEFFPGKTEDMIEKDVERGLKYFGKYFTQLWD